MLVYYNKCLYVCTEQINSNSEQMYYKMANETIPKNGYNFKDAYDELSRKNQRILREKLCNELHINRCSFYYRVRGVIPTYPEYLLIKQAFAEAGIEKVFKYEREADIPAT